MWRQSFLKIVTAATAAILLVSFVWAEDKDSPKEAEAPAANWAARAKSPDRRVRGKLIDELWGEPARAAVPILIELLADEEVGLSAANALHGYHDKGVELPTAEVIHLLRHKEPRARANAAYLLQKLGKNDAACAALIAVSDDENPYVRQEIYEALSVMQDEKATGVLIRALEREEKYWWLREAAARALHVARGTNAAPVWVAVLQDKDVRARRNAVRALQHCGDKTAVSDLIRSLRDADSAVRATAAFTLHFLKEPSCGDALIYATGDEDQGVRRSAVFSLGALKVAASVPRLLEMLKTEDKRGIKTIIKALGSIEDKRAGKHIAPYLDDPELRQITLTSLQEIAAPDSIAPIVTWLKRIQQATPPHHDNRRQKAQWDYLPLKAASVVSMILWKNREALQVTDEKRLGTARQAVEELRPDARLKAIQLYSVGLASVGYEVAHHNCEYFLLEWYDGQWKLLQHTGTEK